MLNEQILNSEVGLFIGAGASAPFGKLLMDSFVDSILNKPLEENVKMLLTSLCSVKKKDLEEILEDVRMFIDKDYYNKMDANGDLYTYCQYNKKIRNVAIVLDRIIRKEIIEHYRGVEDIQLIMNKYNPLFELISQYTNTVPVFTTNYDDIVEELCVSQEGSYHLVNGSRYERKHRDDVLSFKEYEEFKPVSNKMNIVLFKLHGSICWEFDAQKGIIRVSPRPIFDDYDPDVLKFYIAPTKTKIAEDYPYRDLYEYLLRCLDRVKLFIVMGYSFRDYDSLTKFKSSLDFNPGLKLVILNDKAEQLKKTLFESYKDRVVTIPCLFAGDKEGEYLSIIKNELSKLKIDRKNSASS